MKTLAMLALSVLLFGSCFAQNTVTTTTNASGTITEFIPGEALVIRSEQDSAPLRYALTKRTIIVDESGAPVDVATIRSGAPVIVTYSREGDRMLVSKVVVRKPALIERQTTTTTTEER